jgi:hypothetical protein
VSADWNDKRRRLLERIQTVGGVGRAEGEPQERLASGFYPVTEHLRMLDPEVVLVVGPRGVGKTEIARVLTDAKLGPAIIGYAPAVRLPKGETTWKRGYPLDREGFDVGGLRRYVEKDAGVEVVRDLWFAYLVRALRDSLDPGATDKLKALLGLQGGDPQRNQAAFQQAGSEPVDALDRLDQRLEYEDQHLFVTYDELDMLGGGDWRLMEVSIRGLVAFWAAYARRWRRIRAKIFLRTDLYERHATVGGADLAKLGAGRVELAWSDRDLYGMLLKRLANVDSELSSYIRSAKAEITWRETAGLGIVPVLESWREARPVVERMMGPYMGANRKKGHVYRWLLDHVRDGRGRALPRPFVRLVEEAARIELRGFERLREPRLLAPASLRRALDRVSTEYVEHARDEWPWLASVKECLKGQLVPWERERDVVKSLEGLTTPESPPARPPFEGRELLDYLIEVGILRRRSDDRIDAADLFLAGLGLKRKGGVRRK